jgi:SpoIID/LytB domain protein
MTWRRRLGRLMAIGTLAAGTTAVIGTSAPSAHAATIGTSIPITGHGFGHGLGMGQVGAYGYATHFGWTWQQILAHFYPGTTLATANGAETMTVRLTALDDQPVTAAIQDGGQLGTSANGFQGRFGSIAAVQTAPGHYRVYGYAGVVCPDATTTGQFEAPGSPWTVLAADVAFVDITTPEIDTTTAAAANLPGLCQPAGDQFSPTIAARYYRGTLRALTGTSGERRTIDIVPLDIYVREVVPREMPAVWGADAGGTGENALRAQAVAARSYALASNRYAYAKICDTQNCQVFGGAGYRAAVNPGAGGPSQIVAIEASLSDQAVADTAGVVVTSGGAVLSTLYAASTGGFTADGIVDDGDQYSPFADYHTWTTTLTAAAIQAAYPQIGALTDLAVNKRNGFGDFGGRVLSMDVVGTAGRVTVSGSDFANALGLKSNWFSVPTACDGRAAPPPTGVPAAAPARFAPVTPTRVLDTRSGVGTVAAPLAATCTMALTVPLSTGVPANATAVALNITATQATAPGFLTVYPCGEPQPTASSVNYVPGQDVANMTTVLLGAGGQICVYAMSTVHVVVDVLGWYGPGAPAGLAPLVPARVMDTRNGTGIGGERRPITAGGDQPLHLAGVAGVPADASGVVLNVTDTEAAGPGYLTVYACGQAPPLSSNLNFSTGQNVANQVVVGLAADGTVCVTSFATSHVVVDVLGWYGPSASAAYVALPPTRIIDTRGSAGAVGALQVATVAVAGHGGIPASGAGAAVLNVTVDQPSDPGYVTAFPCGQGVPLASNLNYRAGSVAANLVTVPLADNGSVCLFTYAKTHIVVDVAGYFTG